jgi:O-antigen/teichoic acid export membrane protein
VEDRRHGALAIPAGIVIRPAAGRDAALRGTLGSIATGGSLQLVVAASGILAARLLGVADRGHLALLWVLTLAVGQLSTLGLHVGIAYQVAGGRSPQQVCWRLRGIIAAQLLLSTAVGAAVVLPLMGGVRGQSPASLAMALAVPPMFVLLLHGIALAQGQRRYRRVQLHRLVQPCAYVVILVALAATDEGRLDTVTAAWGATMIAAGLFAWRQCLGSWWPRRPTPAPTVSGPDDGSPRAVMAFGLRSLFSAFGVVEHLQADQLLVGLLLSAQQFGLYVAGAAFANLPRFLGQSVGYVAYPEVAAADPARRRAMVARFMMIGALVVLPVVVALVALLGWLLPLLFGHSFHAAVPIGRILLAAAFAQALRRVAAEALRGLGSGVSATWAELAFIAVFAATIAPMTSWHAGTGAALALLIASGAGAIVLVALTMRPGSLVPARAQTETNALSTAGALVASEPPQMS